jgi:uncharacterized repeat protein (TIGR03803 family)
MQTKRLPAGVATVAAAVVIAGFALAAPPSPATAYSVLYKFNGGADGGSPYDSGLPSNTIGNLLYGTTYYGGAKGYGTVYNVTKSGAINLLHSFSGADGEYPNAGVIFDSAGNLYGTASGGGKYGYGVVFKIFASGKFKVIWSFGAEPIGGVPWVIWPSIPRIISTAPQNSTEAEVVIARGSGAAACGKCRPAGPSAQCHLVLGLGSNKT